MNDELKEFIENNIDEINNNEWTSVYDNACFTLDPDNIGILTTTLQSVGIDPIIDGNLDYMPEDYLFGCKLSAEFKIPSVVKKLSYSCFSHASGIDFLEIPESVTEIDELVFFNSLIKYVKIPPSVKNIHITAFDLCDCTIVCKKGTFAEHYAIEQRIRVEYYE